MKLLRHNKHSFTAMSCLSFAVALCCVMLTSTGCLGFSQKESVACYVDDVEIYESSVTSYIEGFRNLNEDCETDTGWAQFLVTNGMTAESMRNYVLNEVFIPQAIVNIECDELGIVVTDKELDSYISKQKDEYEEVYGADSWASALTSYGYDEQTWRESEEYNLLKSKLMEEVVGDVELSDAQLQAYISTNSSTYNGKHSYYYVYDSEDAANATLNTIIASVEQAAIASGTTDEATTATEGQLPSFAQETASGSVVYTIDQQYFTATGSPTDAGWSSLEKADSTVASIAQITQSGAYQTAVNELEKGQMSSVIKCEERWVIIYCDNSFQVQQDAAYLNLSDIPTDILTQFKIDGLASLKNDEFDSWLKQRIDEASINIVSMPEGLSYDVSTTYGAGS